MNLRLNKDAMGSLSTRHVLVLVTHPQPNSDLCSGTFTNISNIFSLPLSKPLLNARPLKAASLTVWAQ